MAHITLIKIAPAGYQDFVRHIVLKIPLQPAKKINMAPERYALQHQIQAAIRVFKDI